MGIPRYSGRRNGYPTELDPVIESFSLAHVKSARYTSHKRFETVKWCKRLDKPVPKHILFPQIGGLMTDNQRDPGIEQHQRSQRSHITYAYRDMIMETSFMWIILSEHRLDRAWRFNAPAARFGVEDFADISDAQTAL
ncbi:hypothetical protein EPUS_06692 [Endocarpon pusillum Z07020]|uniref:Uncharacterized protein n=1 Tax=Endocarpon pusillum (strain Z07020 / HMAS-L-300199) TaxID=1263415 RepID=U1HFV6_ENDPU|nr:uncharacterized protein EPUS_06692 [Endocarpon pusillum Z07020]ERF69005.1 hypothetical protein EPUS_06692 [Endocarpon pusillum Z07020]